MIYCKAYVKDHQANNLPTFKCITHWPAAAERRPNSVPAHVHTKQHVANGYQSIQHKPLPDDSCQTHNVMKDSCVDSADHLSAAEAVCGHIHLPCEKCAICSSAQHLPCVPDELKYHTSLLLIIDKHTQRTTCTCAPKQWASGADAAAVQYSLINATAAMPVLSTNDKPRIEATTMCHWLPAETADHAALVGHQLANSHHYL
jgi:hypothetical protein